MEPPSSKRWQSDLGSKVLTGCLHHGYSSNHGKLEKFTVASWKTFCAAALWQKDSVYMNLNGYIDGNLDLPKTVRDLYKHHNTLAKSVEITERKQCDEANISSEIGAEPSGTPKLIRSSLSKSNLEKCLICQKDKQLHDNRHHLEPVHPLTLLSAVETLQNAAEIRNDQRVLLQLSAGARAGTDAITGDILIPRSCRSSYTHSRNLKFLEQKDSPDSAYDEAFKRLSAEIQNKIIDGY